MNRRTAVMLTMLLGVLLPRGLWAQDTRSRRTSGSQSSQGKTLRPTGEKDQGADADDRDEPDPSVDDPPAGLLHESGFQMRTYDIARYTKVAQGQQNPQKAIIEWIFRRTGTGRLAWREDRGALPARPRCGPTTARRSSSRSARSSSGSPTRPTTSWRCTCGSLSPPTPAGGTRSSRSSRPWATVPRGSRSGRCGCRTRRWSSRRCSFSRVSASWPMSGSRWSTARS